MDLTRIKPHVLQLDAAKAALARREQRVAELKAKRDELQIRRDTVAQEAEAEDAGYRESRLRALLVGAKEAAARRRSALTAKLPELDEDLALLTEAIAQADGECIPARETLTEAESTLRAAIARQVVEATEHGLAQLADNVLAPYAMMAILLSGRPGGLVGDDWYQRNVRIWWDALSWEARPGTLGTSHPSTIDIGAARTWYAEIIDKARGA